MENLQGAALSHPGAEAELLESEYLPVTPLAKPLIVSSTIPPSKMGSAVIVGNLLAKLEPAEAVVVSEGTFSELHYTHGQATYYFQSEFTWPRRGRRYLRWVRWARFRSLVRLIDHVSEQSGRGPIIAIFPDEFFVAAARVVAKRRGLPFFPYFHNTYCDNRTGLSRIFGKGIESRIIRDADAVIVLTSALEDHFQARYPEARFELLPHSFAFDQMTETKPLADGKVRIGILGNINESNTDAFLRLFRALDDSMLVNIYSGATPAWFFEKLGVLGPRVKLQAPSDAELRAKLQENDLLFLPHGLDGPWSSDEYRTIFPTRTVTYLGAGRPILAHCPEQCFLHQWLKQKDCAEIVSSASEESLLDAIHRLASNGARAQEVTQNAERAFREFDPDRVVAELKRILKGETA
jgi:glycosyltransferase involved in cell wall biosynthesis